MTKKRCVWGISWGHVGDFPPQTNIPPIGANLICPPCVSASVCVRTPASLHQFRHQAFASSFCNNLNAYFCKKKSSPISTPYFTIVFTKKSSYSISSYYGIVLCSDSSMTISVNNSSHRVGIIPHQTNISPLYCCFANT